MSIPDKCDMCALWYPPDTFDACRAHCGSESIAPPLARYPNGPVSEAAEIIKNLMLALKSSNPTDDFSLNQIERAVDFLENVEVSNE